MVDNRALGKLSVCTDDSECLIFISFGRSKCLKCAQSDTSSDRPGIIRVAFGVVSGMKFCFSGPRSRPSVGLVHLVLMSCLPLADRSAPPLLPVNLVFTSYALGMHYYTLLFSR